MSGLGITDGAGDESRDGAFQYLPQCGDQFVHGQGYIQIGQGEIPLAQAVGGDHLDAGLRIQAGGLLGGEKDVAVVGEDQEAFRADAVEGLQESLYRRVHRLSALDDFIDAHLAEGLLQRLASSDGHHAERLSAYVEAFVHMVFVVLECHILDLDGEILAIGLAVVQDLARGMGVDVYLDDAAVAEEDERFAVGGEPVGDDRFVERVEIDLAPLETQQELCAVAELQDAVFREGVQVDGGGGGGLSVFRQEGRFTVQGGPHSFRHVEQSGAAAVHDARFLEDVEQFGGMLERQVHRGDQQVEIFLEGPALVGRCDPFAENGQDGALHGLGNGLVGCGHAAGHRLFEMLDVGLFQAFHPLCDAGEDTAQDHARVAAGAHQHSLRYGCGRVAQQPGIDAAARLDGHIHIVSRVSVGNGEDIQVVDGGPVRVEPRRAAADEFEVFFTAEKFHLSWP